MGYEQLRIVDADDADARADKERVLAGLLRLLPQLSLEPPQQAAPPGLS